MGRDPPPVLPGRLAAEEAPAEEAAEVWVRWAVLRLALLLMVLPLLLPRRRRPWVLRLWQRVLWRLLLGLLLGLLLWLLQAVVRRPKEDRGNVAAGDLGEGWQFYLVALLQPLGGLLWLLLLPWLLLRLLLRLVLRLVLRLRLRRGGLLLVCVDHRVDIQRCQTRVVKPELIRSGGRRRGRRGRLRRHVVVEQRVGADVEVHRSVAPR